MNQRASSRPEEHIHVVNGARCRQGFHDGATYASCAVGGVVHPRFACTWIPTAGITMPGRMSRGRSGESAGHLSDDEFWRGDTDLVVHGQAGNAAARSGEGLSPCWCVSSPPTVLRMNRVMTFNFNVSIRGRVNNVYTGCEDTDTMLSGRRDCTNSFLGTFSADVWGRCSVRQMRYLTTRCPVGARASFCPGVFYLQAFVWIVSDGMTPLLLSAPHSVTGRSRRRGCLLVARHRVALHHTVRDRGLELLFERSHSILLCLRLPPRSASSDCK